MDSSLSITTGTTDAAEERRNIYGSILDAEEEMEEIVVGSEERIKCCCKGLCARKSGKGACKCREADLKCVDLCSCQKAKCKNRDRGNGNQLEPHTEQQNEDGATRFELQVQNSEKEIKEFVATLDTEKKDEILITLLNMGRGSLDFAKKLAAGDNPDEPVPSVQSPPWCRCKVCQPMQTDVENVCCKRVTCITSYTSFSNICLDRDILEVCIKARCDIRADEFNFSMESFRKASYRQFAIWKYGKLGRGNRRVIPACAVRMIRSAYPAPDRVYMGFRAN